jgi:hypothetical protein
MIKEKDLERERALKQLRTIARRTGYKFYCVLRHVSRSGMFRAISIYAKGKEGLIWCDGYIARAGIFKMTKNRSYQDGLAVSGCGMDMGFHVVYEVSRTMYPKGFKDGDNDNRDGGYRIKHEWI